MKTPENGVPIQDQFVVQPSSAANGNDLEKPRSDEEKLTSEWRIELIQQQIDSGERKSVLVPIDVLIPGIKLRLEETAPSSPDDAVPDDPQAYVSKLVEISRSSNSSPGIRNEEPYILNFLQNFHFGDVPGARELDKSEGEVDEYAPFSNAVEEKFKGQIVVDLGAGLLPSAYAFFSRFGVRGYVGVEKNFAPQLADGLGHGHTELQKDIAWRLSFTPFRDRKMDQFPQQECTPPASVVAQDMLSFLERLPDDSVSIFSSGSTYLFTPYEDEYVRETIKEIKRVLHPDGAFLGYESVLSPNGLVDIGEEIKATTFGEFQFHDQENSFLAKKALRNKLKETPTSW
jgi:hypothetical protein